MEALLETHNLSRAYNGRYVVDTLDLSLQQGEVLGLLGPNGAGKSTTLRMLCGDLAPTSGTVRIGGADLQSDPLAAKGRLGYLPERPPLHPDQRVDEFLLDCARLHRLTGRQAHQALTRAKGLCGLESVGKRLIRNLSKGYQQRLGIAQAIQHGPAVIVLDEPTDGLDPAQIREVRALIRRLAENAGVILSSHILPEIQAVCDRVVILQDGRSVYAGDIAPPKTTTLKLELAQPPALELIAALPPVARAQRLQGDCFRVTLKPHSEVSQFARLLVERGWGLQQLTPESLNLEQIFMQATSGQGV